MEFKALFPSLRMQARVQFYRIAGMILEVASTILMKAYWTAICIQCCLCNPISLSTPLLGPYVILCALALCEQHKVRSWKAGGHSIPPKQPCFWAIKLSGFMPIFLISIFVCSIREGTWPPGSIQMAVPRCACTAYEIKISLAPWHWFFMWWNHGWGGSKA